MILNKKTIILVLIFFLFNNFSYSKINLQIVMKINGQIVTSYDLEKESNYLLALNPRLKEISKNELVEIAKKSIIKEMIRKSEILKYKDLNLQNAQIDDVLNSVILNLDFSNQTQFEKYLSDYNISINDFKKKIEIENEWKNLIYSKYSKSVKIDKDSLINKIEKTSKDELSLEYNLSEIIFDKKQNIPLEEHSVEIVESIETNGFENTANLYSISDSSKVGGKIGWVKKNNLSLEINRELENLKINSYSNPIKIDNNYLILKINDIKEITVKIDKQKELDKMIMIETSKQLDKFSDSIKETNLTSLSSDSIKLILLVCIFIILKSVNKIYTKNIPFLTRNPKLKSLMEGKLPTIDPIFNRQRKAYKKYDHHCLLDIDSNLHEIFLKAEKNDWSIEQLRTVLIKYTPNVGFGIIPSLFGRNIQGKHLIRETGELRDSPGEIAKAIVYYSAMTDKVNFTSIALILLRLSLPARVVGFGRGVILFPLSSNGINSISTM